MKRGQPFTRDSIKMSNTAFDEAIKSLIAKGLAEEVMIDGVKHYKVTSFGETVYDHTKTAPEKRN
jgi:predicted transcriptional regulator with HTH domain